MTDKEILGLWEAYNQIYTQVEDVEQLDELSLDTLRSARKKRFKKVDEIESSGGEDAEGRKKLRRTQKAIARKTSPGQPDDPHKGASARLNMEMEYDAFDAILEHLLDEGYADTNEAALVIMANMSEEWRQSIVEGKKEFPHKRVDRQVYDAMDSGETAGDSGDSVKQKRDYDRADKMRSVAAKHGGKTRG
jgi:hypothetical protein